MHSIHRFARHRPRLLIGIGIGTLAGLLVHREPVMNMLIGWNVGVWFYLLAIGWLIAGAKPSNVLSLAEQEESSAAAVLAVMSTSALASLAAIVVELAASRGLPPPQRLDHYAFTFITLLGSWLLVGMLFTFHYAHLYYRAPADNRPLVFPGGETQPDYWDFLYFSFTIAVAAQTSDVTVTSRRMRRVVLVQSVLSFLSNLVVLGLSINIAAGVIGA